jgi:hypothetical protein
VAATRSAHTRPGQATSQPKSGRAPRLFWADNQFLVLSTSHLDRALKLLKTGPQLDPALVKEAVEVRHLLEHWWDAGPGRGAWKGLRARYGEFASPNQVMFMPPDDLRIGPASLSVGALAKDIRRVEQALVGLEQKS